MEVVTATTDLVPGFWGSINCGSPMVQDNDFKIKYEFSRGQPKIDDMKILKQNIVKFIEFVKIP
jgi:hypothetical protein